MKIGTTTEVHHTVPEFRIADEIRSRHSDWDNWKWQLRNQITTVEGLAPYVELTEQACADIRIASEHYRWAVTPYYASLMARDDPNCPLRRQQLPSIEELSDAIGLPDPLFEREHSPVDAIVHVYPDRVAFKITNVCPTYCRYCFREYFVGNLDESHTRAKVEEGLAYIRRTPEIRDVLITGGDPFLFSDERLEHLLTSVRAIPHVEIIRFGTRTPCTLPQRITPELCQLLERYHPIWVNTQFNHPAEITAEAALACDRLLKAGIPLGNQTVLLKGVNDDVTTMRDLVKSLLRIRVRPYYLFQCQALQGTAHLRTSIEKGIEIIENLRGHVTGFAVPTFVLDTPYGKAPVNPQYVIGRDGDDFVVRTYQGKVWRERNPLEPGQQPFPMVRTMVD